MYVLGINSVFHESAACLLDNGRMVATVEEERFTRIKHAKTPQLNNPDILPLHAMCYCFDLAGIDITQVDYIGYSSSPDARAEAGMGEDSYEMAEFEQNIRNVPDNLRTRPMRLRRFMRPPSRTPPCSASMESATETPPPGITAGERNWKKCGRPPRRIPSGSCGN